MQLIIELPDDLWQKVLQRDNVQEFIETAIKKQLLKEQCEQEETLITDLLAMPEVADIDFG